MDLKLSGKVAFVSGSTAGIGLAIANRMALEGADVVINGRTEERVRVALAQIEKDARNVDVRGIAADLGQAEGCAEIARQLPRVEVESGLFAGHERTQRGPDRFYFQRIGPANSGRDDPLRDDQDGPVSNRTRAG